MTSALSLGPPAIWRGNLGTLPHSSCRRLWGIANESLGHLEARHHILVWPSSVTLSKSNHLFDRNRHGLRHTSTPTTRSKRLQRAHDRWVGLQWGSGNSSRKHSLTRFSDTKFDFKGRLEDFCCPWMLRNQRSHRVDSPKYDWSPGSAPRISRICCEPSGSRLYLS
jgi:hypothetical protein